MKPKYPKILIVDDNTANLVTLEMGLEDLDAEFVRALSGNEAVKLTMRQKFSLILMDVQMPGMDGFETVDLIRKVDLNKHVPVIFVTAINKEEKHVWRGYEAGAVDYIFKPLDPDILECKVSIFLELDKVQSELATLAIQKTALADLRRFALVQNNTHALMNEASRVLMDTLDCEFGRIVEYARDGSLHRRRGWGWEDEKSDDTTIFSTANPVESQESYTLWTKKAVWMENLADEKRFSLSPLLRKHNVVSGMSVIIGESKRPWGVLGIHSAQALEFNNAEIHFLQDVANILFDAFNRQQMEGHLIRSKKNESMEIMASSFAHNFNNLLQSIIGNHDLALDSLPPGAEAQRLIEQAGKSCQRAADMCMQLLSYLGQGNQDRESCNLTELVQKTSSRFKESCPENVTVIQNPDQEAILIAANAERMEQLLMNLLQNAAEAIGDAPGKNFIATRIDHCVQEEFKPVFWDEKLPDGQSAVLEVIDTGSGLDDTTQEKMFDPFYTTHFEGRGLGLPVVLGIVRAHHGAISVEAEKGKATTFKIIFPLPDNTP